MNNTDNICSESGNEAASAQPAQESKLQDEMKRAAAKQLIEAYYFQLTDGCGNTDCGNVHCASCQHFSMKDKDRNALAVMSIELFKQQAKLCETEKLKIARLPESNDDSPVSPGPSSTSATTPLVRPFDSQALSAGLSSSGPSTSEGTDTVSPTKSLVSMPGPSSSTKPSGGATPKSTATTPTEPKEIPYLDEEKLEAILTHCRESNDWSMLIKSIGSVFSSPESLIRSFRVKVAEKQEPNKEESICEDTDVHMEAKDDSESGERIHEKLREGSKLGLVDFDDLGDVSVDLSSIHRCYGLLMETPDLPFQNALINALRSLSKTLDLDFRYTRQLQHQPNYLNIFVIIMEIPLLHSPEFIESAYPEFCKALGQLPVSGQVSLAKYWSNFSGDRVTEMVLSLQQLITVKLIQGEAKWGRGLHLNDDEAITEPIKVMKVLYHASMYGGEKDSADVLEEERGILESENQLQSELLGASAMGYERESKEPRQTRDDPMAKELDITHADCRVPLVPYDSFVNETLNETLSVEIDYKYKLESEDDPSKFSFANYSFVFNTPSKQASLYMDNRIQMYKERRSSILQTLMHGMPPMPFLRIRVSRNRIIDDALVALEMVAMENPSDLRKQLFVEFDGEQGVDEGGVSKEFFQLIIEEIFNVDFGMFTYNSDTRQFWFNSMSFENDGQFTLIGIVLGLAIYNSTIVDVHFPSVVYRKLVGKLGTFKDLRDVDPTLAKNLQEMLEYKEVDFEDVFMQSFQISYKDVFGSTITHELKDKGDSIPVTQDSKQEFVSLYADFVLNKSIEKQFRAFRRGFQMVTNESPLRTLFMPSEIELLICGSEDYDFNALEDACEYDGGFDKQSTTIRDFWSAVHSFDEEKKRQLLQFTTGTDRVPVGGLAKLKLIIARNGPDSDRLPTAHTCFNVLLLPDYQNRSKLEERLLKAITYSKGFGML